MAESVSQRQRTAAGNRRAAAVVSPAYGFSFNNSAVAAKLDACRALKNSYHNGLMCGYLDSEEALPEFLEELEQAGIQEILQAKQSALDNWLNASH